MDGPLGDLELGGELRRGQLAAGLEEEQERHEAGCAHLATIPRCMTGSVMLARTSPTRSESTARVAAGRISPVVPDREPVLPLLGRAVRPRIRVDLALRCLLDPIVTDGGSRIEGVGDIGLGDLLEVAGARRMVRPDACVAIGLEFRAHRSTCRASTATAARQRTEQILDVVAVLVREDVSLRERATLRPESRSELAEEVEVEIDELVSRTVERAGRGARGPAAARRGSGEEDRVDR